MPPQQGLDNRHRKIDGEVSRKYGKIELRKLRQIYGQDLAPGIGDDVKLGDVLLKLDEPSLRKLVRGLQSGRG